MHPLEETFRCCRRLTITWLLAGTEKKEVSPTFEVKRDDEFFICRRYRHPYPLCARQLSLLRYKWVRKIPVVRMALPANDVSTRWFRAKLFPTDCWPMDETTFTGYVEKYQ
jgi:hypothetical protein